MAVPEKSLTIVADEVFGLIDAPREVPPYTGRFPGYGLEDAYRVVENIRMRRETRGERIVGRKIGFTNAAAWAGYGISGPIWNYLYEATTLNLARASSQPIAAWPNVRIEVEVALGICEAPGPQMDEDALLRCVDWVALDFELCTSVFPDWRFDVADAATTGVHVALLLGPRRSIVDDRSRWADDLKSFRATLAEEGGAYAAGGGAQVLGSPLVALQRLVRELSRSGGQPLRAGDIVTTGTLTEALAAKSGQCWTARVDGLRLEPIEVRLG